MLGHQVKVSVKNNPSNRAVLLAGGTTPAGTKASVDGTTLAPSGRLAEKVCKAPLVCQWGMARHHRVSRSFIHLFIDRWMNVHLTVGGFCPPLILAAIECLCYTAKSTGVMTPVSQTRRLAEVTACPGSRVTQRGGGLQTWPSWSTAELSDTAATGHVCLLKFKPSNI